MTAETEFKERNAETKWSTSTTRYGGGLIETNNPCTKDKNQLSQNPFQTNNKMTYFQKFSVSSF
jgi:hypothetical protein